MDHHVNPPLNTVRPTQDFRVGTNNFAMQGMGPTPLGGDMHQSMQFDAQGNIRNDHVTFQIPGGQKLNLYNDR